MKLTRSVSEIPFGDAGIYETIAAMRRLARTPSLAVSRLATVWTLGARTQMDRALALHDALAKAFDYQDDGDVETIYTPDLSARRVLDSGKFFGDCDDLSVLTAALGLAVGVPAAFVIVAECSDPKCDGVTPFSHVYSLLYPLLNDGSGSIGTVDFDLSRPDLPPPVSRVVVFPV